jgi:YD repeat-containing protein
LTRTGYDAVGNVRTVTDPRGNVTGTDYNGQNLPTLVSERTPPPWSPKSPNRTGITLDAIGSNAKGQTGSNAKNAKGQA